MGVQKKSGIPCGLQRLSYAGKHMDDSQRTLEQCGKMSCTCGTLMYSSGSLRFGGLCQSHHVHPVQLVLASAARLADNSRHLQWV